MSWKKYQPRRSGECHVNLNGEGLALPFEIGIVETRRSRVFAGHYVKSLDRTA